MAMRKIQPVRSQDKGMVQLSKQEKRMHVPERTKPNRMPFIKGVDDTVEMRIKPLPKRWQEDCVWIRVGKLEKKVKRENLDKYPDHVVIPYRL